MGYILPSCYHWSWKDCTLGLYYGRRKEDWPSRAIFLGSSKAYFFPHQWVREGPNVLIGVHTPHNDQRTLPPLIWKSERNPPLNHQNSVPKIVLRGMRRKYQKLVASHASHDADTYAVGANIGLYIIHKYSNDRHWNQRSPSGNLSQKIKVTTLDNWWLGDIVSKRSFHNRWPIGPNSPTTKSFHHPLISWCKQCLPDFCDPGEAPRNRPTDFSAKIQSWAQQSASLAPYTHQWNWMNQW